MCSSLAVDEVELPQQFIYYCLSMRFIVAPSSMGAYGYSLLETISWMLLWANSFYLAVLGT